MSFEPSLCIECKPSPGPSLSRIHKEITSPLCSARVVAKALQPYVMEAYLDRLSLTSEQLQLDLTAFTGCSDGQAPFYLGSQDDPHVSEKTQSTVPVALRSSVCCWCWCCACASVCWHMSVPMFCRLFDAGMQIVRKQRVESSRVLSRLVLSDASETSPSRSSHRKGSQTERNITFEYGCNGRQQLRTAHLITAQRS